MAKQVTITDVVEKRMKLHCKQQDFEAAARVREIKLALKDNDIPLTKRRRRAVYAFLDIVAHR